MGNTESSSSNTSSSSKSDGDGLIIKEKLEKSLFQQAYRGNMDSVRDALEGWSLPWVDVNAQEEQKGMTLLHAASLGGRLELVQYLLDRGAVTDIVDKEGNTPLHLASSVEIVREFIQVGASPSTLNFCGQSLVHSAVKSERESVVQFLLQTFPELVLLKDGAGKTPLHHCGTHGRAVVVKMLLEQFRKTSASSVENRTRMSGIVGTAEEIVVEEWQDGVTTDYLVEQWVNTQDVHGNTALHYAAGAANGTMIVRVLIENGGDFQSIVNNHGRNAMGCATSSTFPYFSDSLKSIPMDVLFDNEQLRVFVEPRTKWNMVKQMVDLDQDQQMWMRKTSKEGGNGSSSSSSSSSSGGGNSSGGVSGWQLMTSESDWRTALLMGKRDRVRIQIKQK